MTEVRRVSGAGLRQETWPDRRSPAALGFAAAMVPQDPLGATRPINARRRNAWQPEPPSGAPGAIAAACCGDGFYEWKGRPWPGRKQPGLIRRRDRRPFWLAGLWDRWIRSRWQSEVESCCLLTTAPNRLVAADPLAAAGDLPPAWKRPLAWAPAWPRNCGPGALLGCWDPQGLGSAALGRQFPSA